MRILHGVVWAVWVGVSRSLSLDSVGILATILGSRVSLYCHSLRVLSAYHLHAMWRVWANHTDLVSWSLVRWLLGLVHMVCGWEGRPCHSAILLYKYDTMTVLQYSRMAWSLDRCKNGMALLCHGRYRSDNAMLHVAVFSTWVYLPLVLTSGERGRCGQWISSTGPEGEDFKRLAIGLN